MASARYTVQVEGRTVEVEAEVFPPTREERAQGYGYELVIDSALCGGRDLTSPEAGETPDDIWEAIERAVIEAYEERRYELSIDVALDA